MASITAQLEAQWSPDIPVYVVPEHEALGRPTIATIAKTLGAEVVHGEEEQLNREVLAYKVAAMQVAVSWNIWRRAVSSSLRVTGPT